MAAKGCKEKAEKRFDRAARRATLLRMNDASPTLPDIADDTTAAFLWRWVFRHLAWFVEMFGGLTVMACVPIARVWVMREARMRLRVLGALVRRLIFAMAAALEPPALRDTASREATASERKPREAEPETDDPETWHVCFVIAPSAPMFDAHTTGSTATPPQPFVHFNPFALKAMAHALEAIRRVIADPAPYARRMARLHTRDVVCCGADEPLLRGAERSDKADLFYQLHSARVHVLDAIARAARRREDSS